MRKPQHWFTQVRKRFFPSSHREITILHSSSPSDVTAIREAGAIAEDHYGSTSSTPSSLKKQLTREDLAALKIQANFRGHLARRAFRALRSLVKLQALVRGVCVRRQAQIAVRGVCVRRQAQIAMQCMHALVRLQVRVRARQLLSQCSDN